MATNACRNPDLTRLLGHIVNFRREMLARLVLPALDPIVDYDFVKAYYARFSDRLHGRVTRLYVAPLLAAFRRLGTALTPTPVPIRGAGLRTGGAYRYVRHPIYSAVLLITLGFLVAMGSPLSWVWGAVMLLFFWAKSRWEDALLREAYGDEWTQWAQTTGALVPRMRPGRDSA